MFGLPNNERPQVSDLIGMRPLNLVLFIVITLCLAILLGWTQNKHKATKISVWTGTILILLVVRWFAPFDIGPASWADVTDWIMPDGYAQHSVETSISVGEHWIVGETKECSSSPLRYDAAYRLGKEPGFVAASIKCDEGPMHMVTVNLYGRLSQPKDRIAYWRCTRESEGFTCRQTGAEKFIDSR